MATITAGTRNGVAARPALIYTQRADGTRYSQWSLAVILAVMLCQVAFLVFGCDWDLCADEAEYWAWSRHLDWSYFSRGPLIAWLIRLATTLFGGLSVTLTGSLMLAVRLPAVLLGGLTAWGVFRLATLATGSARSALMAVLLLPAIPVMAVGGVVITSDTPLVCCWVWAAIWTFRATQSEQTGDWLAAGLIGALGVWAKYSFLVFLVSTGLFLFAIPAYRHQLRRRGFWAMALLSTGLGLAPILMWNIQHGWAGAGQLADRVGLSSRATWAGSGPLLTFLGGEFAALGGVWWVAGLAAIGNALRSVLRKSGLNSADRPSQEISDARVGLIYLLCLWAPIWAACFAASLLGETEVNWMVPGYISLVILIGVRMDQALTRGGMRKWLYAAAWLISISAVIMLHHTEWFYPVIARHLPAPTERFPVQLRVYEPTSRMRGHQVLARAVRERIEALRARGESPFILTSTYGLASTLSFYLPGQPDTYCLSWNFGMTPSPVNQHDLWHPNPRHEPDAFCDRPAIVIDDRNMPPSNAKLMVRKKVFGRLESHDLVTDTERGATVGSWFISVCYDYHGVSGYRQNGAVR